MLVSYSFVVFVGAASNIVVSASACCTLTIFDTVLAFTNKLHPRTAPVSNMTSSWIAMALNEFRHTTLMRGLLLVSVSRSV